MNWKVLGSDDSYCEAWQREVAAIWPELLPEDSEQQRRKKVVVRSAQVAVVAMIAAAIAGAILADHASMSMRRTSLLVLSGLAYALWCLHGMSRTIRDLLWESSPGVLAKPQPASGWIARYFAIQLILAGLVFTLGNQARGGALAWLVLLPPVAHAVILLRITGVSVVSGISITILSANVITQQGWVVLPGALVAFAFSVFFTIIFTQLAVSAERARNEAQALADELAAACEKLRRAALQAEELAEARERNRLAREIHDILGHSLTVVNVHLEAARAVQEHDPLRAREAVAKAQELTQEGLREVRRSVAALRAAPLENLALVDGLKRLAAQAQASGLVVGLRVLGDPRTLSRPVELSLYRAAQEGLTNVRKHAHTDNAELILEFTSEGKTRVEVVDSGSGSTLDETRGFGLLGLRERASLLGGEVCISSAPGQGFKLQLEVPA